MANDVFMRVMKALVEARFAQEGQVHSLETPLATLLHTGSSDMSELIMALEKEFGVEVPVGDLTDPTTVGDIVDYFADWMARVV